jgi:hypothetical protein
MPADVSTKMHAPPSARRLAGKFTVFLFFPDRTGRTPKHGAEFAVVMTMEFETFDRKLDQIILLFHWHDSPLSSVLGHPVKTGGLFHYDEPPANGSQTESVRSFFDPLATSLIRRPLSGF